MTDKTPVKKEMQARINIVDQCKDEVRAAVDEHIAVLAKDSKLRESIVSYSLSAIMSNPSLAQKKVIDNGSLRMAVVDLMNVGLPPNGKVASIVAWGGIAQAMIQYQGMVRLFQTAYPELELHSNVVYEGQEFVPPTVEIVNGTMQTVFKHQSSDPPPRVDKSNPIDAAQVVAAYTYAINKKRKTVEGNICVVYAAELKKLCAKSKGAGGKSPSPAWASFTGEMCIKSAIRRFAKMWSTDGSTPALDNKRLAHAFEIHDKGFDLDITPEQGDKPDPQTFEEQVEKGAALPKPEETETEQTTKPPEQKEPEPVSPQSDVPLDKRPIPEGQEQAGTQAPVEMITNGEAADLKEVLQLTAKSVGITGKSLWNMVSSKFEVESLSGIPKNKLEEIAAYLHKWETEGGNPDEQDDLPF